MQVFLQKNFKSLWSALEIELIFWRDYFWFYKKLLSRICGFWLKFTGPNLLHRNQFDNIFFTMGNLLSFYCQFFATQIIVGAKELVVLLWLCGNT